MNIDFFINKPKLALIERLYHVPTAISNIDGYIEILVAESDTAKIDILNQRICINSQQCLIIQDKTGYRMLPNSNKKPPLRIIIHDFQLRGHKKNRLMDSSFSLLDLKKSPPLFLSNCMYLEQAHTHNELYETILNSILLFIFYGTKNTPEPPKIIPKKISDITNLTKVFIEENYAQEISLTHISTHVNFSIYYIAHIFKKEMGLSPIQYLMHCRMNKAKELLSDTKRTVADIATEVGYQNKNYFAFLFKRNIGLTPGKYRDKCQP